MMKILALLSVIILLSIVACNQKEMIKVEYPETKKVAQEDDYFGTKISDPYRWLENDTSKETAEWVKAQNKVTFDYFSKIPFRDKIKERLTQVWDYPRKSALFKYSGHYFYYKNDGLQNQSVLCIQESPEKDAPSEILIDPNTLSADGTVALGSIAVSKDGKYIAYSIASGGSDWNEIHVKDIKSKEDIKDVVKWVKFSGISWYKDGFFYSGYDAPKKGEELTQKNEFHKIYYHKLGTAQDKDLLIMENKKDPLRMFFGSTTDDENFLIVYESTAGKRGSAFYIKDLIKNTPFRQIVSEFDFEYSYFDNDGDILYFRTNKNAPKYKVIAIDFKNPAEENWKDIIPEKDNVLETASVAGNKIIAKYMKDAYTQMEIYDKTGALVRNVELPGIGDVSAFNGNKNDNLAFYSFTSFTTPGDIYKYDVSTGKSDLFETSKIKFDGSEYEVKQVFFTSKDGTKIPMFITHKKGIKLDGNNPTILYGYGGFNVSLNPSFNNAYVVWLENGGIYAMVNLRGGGEYGEKWHEAGTKLKKQNVFDDFIGAAEYLIKEKYTSPSKLAARGGSNGGLLVGAVINQRPDLFGAAIPAVGVMDMLRFQKFTIGWAWVSDYGSSDNKEEFEYILKYSPIHNIKEGTNYPAVLVTTADHDDRVVPAHSFKYIATLQEKYTGPNPILIRIETMAGHSAGKPTSKIIDEYADVWSFLFYTLDAAPEFK